MNPHIPKYQFGNRKKQDFEEFKSKLDQLREEFENKWEQHMRVSTIKTSKV